MGKYVVETVQVIRRKYYVKVDDPTYSHDAIVFNELEPFSSTCYSEDVINTTEVDKFPKADKDDDVNAAVMKFNYETREWETKARWDLS
jgi:hypothetical protein